MTRRLAHLVGSLAILGLALLWVSPLEVLGRLQAAHPGWLLVALICLCLSTLSMARRWQVTAQALALDLRFGAALREYYLSLAMNALLPGGVVGDVSRAIRMRRKGDLARAAQSVLAERLMGQVALLSILGIGLACVLLRPGAVDWPAVTGWILLGAGLCCAVVAIAVARTGWTADFAMFFARLLRRPGVVVHALAAAMLLIAALYACARATGTEVPLDAVVTVLPLVLCAMLIPLSVAGWGWREGAAAALFPLFGASAEAGVAMGICYGALVLLASLPGVVFALGPVARDAAGETG